MVFGERGRERRRIEYLRLLVDDELADVRRPAFGLGRSRCARLSYGQTWIIWLSAPTSECQKAASRENLRRAGNALPKRSSASATVPGFNV
jgi:hypothetical protein